MASSPYNAHNDPDAAPRLTDDFRPSALLPTKTQLTYTKELITVMLLLIALPWVLSTLLKSPASLARSLGGKVAGV